MKQKPCLYLRVAQNLPDNSLTTFSAAIAKNFDRAASNYDESASVQAQVADRLVSWAAETSHKPTNILDLGCGTGFVAQAARHVWPRAEITAMDASPAMLHQTHNKMPDLKIVAGDAAQHLFTEKFNVILSSMMLQWLPQPRHVLERWRHWLKPRGCLYVALPVAGSFQEWRAACSNLQQEDGLWPLSSETFADDFTASKTVEDIKITYPSALEFLRRLKAIGAATPRPNHKVLNAGVMKRLLARASTPFPVTYRILYMQYFPQDNG